MSANNARLRLQRMVSSSERVHLRSSIPEERALAFCQKETYRHALNIVNEELGE